MALSDSFENKLKRMILGRGKGALSLSLPRRVGVDYQCEDIIPSGIIIVFDLTS